MKIGIHISKGSFSDRWIDYCKQNNIEYKIVDCYQNDIIAQLSDCDALMWHFHHASPRDVLFAKQLLYSVKASGKRIFPDFDTVWHFDDKVGQKYLLEAVGAPLVPSYVFYSRENALEWAQSTEFPKVFKLRGGAGSVSVKLVRDSKNAKALIKKAFSKGFKHDSLMPFSDVFVRFKNNQATLIDLVKCFVRGFKASHFSKVNGREKGYIYFQEFIPNNDYDIRVIVVDSKAFAIKRMVRKNDFRASGSGQILYEKDNFDLATITLAIDIFSKLNSQCVAFDFVFRDGIPLIVEISYGFSAIGYDKCVGYWDKNLDWYEGSFNPYGWMVDLILKNISNDFIV